jgi:hypothetical protein
MTDKQALALFDKQILARMPRQKLYLKVKTHQEEVK